MMAGLNFNAIKILLVTHLQVEADPYFLERPEWMNGNPKLFSQDQVKEAKDFQAREKVLLEEKAKKVAELESEFRAAKANVDEATQKFDEAMQVQVITLHKYLTECITCLRAFVMSSAPRCIHYSHSSGADVKAPQGPGRGNSP